MQEAIIEHISVSASDSADDAPNDDADEGPDDCIPHVGDGVHLMENCCAIDNKKYFK